MTTLGKNLAVFQETVVCDGSYEQHEFTVVTDGTTAYASSGRTDDYTFCREGSVLTAQCGEQGWRGEQCNGHFSVDIATPGWPGAKGIIETLAKHGTAVES